MNSPTIVRTIVVSTALAVAPIALEAWVAMATGTTVPLVAIVGVVGAAWYGGIPGGLFTVVLAVALTPLTVPPFDGMHIAEPRDAIRIALLPVLGVGVTLMVAYMRRTSLALEATLASIGDGVLVTDASGRVTRLNGVAERLTGWPAGAGRGRHVDEVFRLLDEHTRRPVESPVARVLRDGRAVALANHTVLVSRDGTERPIDDSAAPVCHHSGRVTGVVLVFRDGSDRRDAARSAGEYRAFVTATSDVVYRMSADWTEMRHLDGKEFIADTTDPSRAWLQKYIPPQDRAEVLAAIRQAIETRRVFELEHRVVRVDGTIGWTLSRAVPLLDDRGEIVEWLGAASDITARRHAEQVLQARERQLARANATKDQFLATVSHELRTPLNAVLGWTMMLRGTTDLEKIERGLRVVDRNARTLLRVVEDLLDFSRTSRGELQIQSAPVDLSAVLREGLEAVRPSAEQKRIGLVAEAPALTVVVGDAARLQQVLTNLLSNAIKFTPEGGSVSVRLRHEGESVVLAVQDTGIGIRPDLLREVFEPFRQIDPRGATGLGLGLAIVRHLVEAHGGRVEAHSDGPGRGATFTVTLPAAVDAAG